MTASFHDARKHDGFVEHPLHTRDLYRMVLPCGHMNGSMPSTKCRLSQNYIIVKEGFIPSNHLRRRNRVRPMTNQMIVKGFSSQRTDTAQRYSCSVTKLGSTRALWFDVNSTGTEPEPASLQDYALLGLLYPAMKYGLNLVIEGEISGPLLFLAREDVQRLLLAFDPSLKRIDIDALPVWNSSHRERKSIRAGTGFSAGVDSFAALASFHTAKLENQARVTDLFLMNVGAFGAGMGRNTQRAFDQSATRMVAYAEKTSRHAHRIDSNLQQFYAADGLPFSKTHTLRNLAVASLFHNEIDIYFYASGACYADTRIIGAKDVAYIDPILIPMLTPLGMRFMGANPGMDRIEKTRLVAEDIDAQKLLDVCVASAGIKAAFAAKGKNCSNCSKCFRTMLTLDALGLLDRFNDVFDVDSYRKRIKGIAESVRRRGVKGSPVDMAAYNAFMASESGAVLAD